MFEYVTHPGLGNLGFYPCSAKWVGFQKFDIGDIWANLKDIFIVSGVGYAYAGIFQKNNKVS